MNLYESISGAYGSYSGSPEVDEVLDMVRDFSNDEIAEAFLDLIRFKKVPADLGLTLVAEMSKEKEHAVQDSENIEDIKNSFDIKSKEDYMRALNKVSELEYNNKITKDDYDELVKYLNNLVPSLRDGKEEVQNESI